MFCSTSLLPARRALICVQCPSSIHLPHNFQIPTAPCALAHTPPSLRRRTFLTPTPTLQQPPHPPSDPSAPVSPPKSILPPPNFADDEPDWTTTSSPPANLPHEFGSNQYMHVDDALKEHLRGLLWQFRAPVRYAFAYGSGVFSQGLSSPAEPAKKRPMIDLIFGVTYTQHWHSINIAQHRDHYSFLGTLGSKVVAHVQDDLGAGVYFNPYVEVNGTLIKYGVVNLSTLHRDLTDWDTLYLAGRLHKPVKILRDDPRIRYANQLNLLSALRTALLLLPEKFTEQELYTTISSISYTGDPRMHLFTENQHKVSNIVTNQLHNFRRLYSPLIEVLPNVDFSTSANTSWTDSPTTTLLTQDMSPVRRANMLRRLPRAFRDRLYFQYQARYKIPRAEFEAMVGLSEDDERLTRKEGGEWERRIVEDESGGGIKSEVGKAVKKTISWASTVQSVKGVVTAGVGRSWRYLGEKMGKWKEGRKSLLEN